MEFFNSVNEQLLSQTKSSILLDKIEFKLNENENNLNDHKQLKQQYHFLKPDPKLQQIDRQNGLSNKSNGIHKNDDGLPSPKHILCSPNAIQLEWKQSRSIGAGYINLGNTCFMNSVLQALTYCPPLVNYFLYSNIDHQSKCKVLGLCMTCELIKHMRNSFQNSGSVIRPQNIFQRLKSLAKQLQPGRQEDSHEFLRYVIDNIWKSCIINWESSHGIKLDSKSKETTFINQIFGGYHRSLVTCLNCKAKSDTYDYFMDFILDIKTASSLDGALKQFIEPEILRNENAYKCSKCNKKVAAEKRFSVHKAPNVATFQLKRFDYNRIFGGKITKSISYQETVDLRPYMSESKGEPIIYKLFAVLVHLGSTSNSGHYFCYVRNSNNNWYLMDDARVASVSLKQVLDQQAYILFYVRIPNKQSINRCETLKINKNPSDKQLSLIQNNNNKVITNQKLHNGLIHDQVDVSKNKPANHLPKLISDTVNGLKKPVTSESSFKLINGNGNRLSLLSEIDSKINNNLSKSSLLKQTTTPTPPTNKSSSDNSRKVVVKRLVPYDNNSSSDDDSKEGKSLLSKESNGIKKFKSGDQQENIKCNGVMSKESNGKQIDESSDEEEQCKDKELIKGVKMHLESHIQSNNEKDKKCLMNGFAKFAAEIGCLVGETDLVKHFEMMSKDKIEFTPGMKKQHQSPVKSLQSTKSNSPQKPINQTSNNNNNNYNNNGNNINNNKSTSFKAESQLSQTAKSQLIVSRTISPMKTNGYLSNNYYQSKQANLLSNNRIVDQSPSKPPGKTSSIASGSSTNSINSTTEWQVIDREHTSLKKHLHRVDNSWEVADLKRSKSRSKSRSPSDLDEENCHIDKEQRIKSNRSINNSLNNSSFNNHSNVWSSDEDVRIKNDKKNLSEMERRFEKKLRKMEKKDKKKFDEVYSNQDALLALYVKMTKKYNKKLKEERKHKKHKKDRSRRESSDSSNRSQESNKDLSQSNQNITDTPSKNNSNQLSKQFNQMFTKNGSNKKDVRSELNDMHLNLLGKNVNTWYGQKTQIDREVKEDLERDKKKSKDDLYNEEYDRGKTKKLKFKSEDRNKSDNQNPFQKIYNERHLKDAIEKNKFIKSL